MAKLFGSGTNKRVTGKEWYNRAGNYLQKEADWARMLSENAYLRGSRDLNNAQRLLFDGAVAGTQMASDVALGTLTGGSAMVPMAIRSFGSGAMEARQAGASENNQILYGAANALAEAATEKMFDGVARIHGKGMADDMVDDFAKRWATSEGGQALLRGAAGMGGEGLEEMVSSLANPALKTLYNGRSLRENYSALNPDDVLYETAIGALLGNIGGVNVMRTVGSAPGSDLSRARPDFLYHAAMDDLSGGVGSAAIENSYLLPYSDTYNTPTSAMGISSTDALQEWIIEQYIAEIEKAKAADASERAYYKELEHKYLRGNISEEEFEELRKLENIWGQFDAAAKTNGISAKERYRKLEQKFRNGNINEQEWNELIRLEDTLKQSDAPSKRTGSDLKPRTEIQKGETEAWQKSLQNKENIATLMSKINSREISTRIRSQVQGKHIEGTKQFDEYLDIRRARGQMPQSILTISEQEAQELVDKYRGTGDVEIQLSGENSLRIYEFCDADRIVGKWYEANSFHTTKRFQIIYSKKGTHIVPVKEDYND